MTIRAQQLLNSFDLLPQVDKDEVAAEILRRFIASVDELSDNEMDAAAAELFRALDAEESQDLQR
jgi:hypothetical protein